jgi:hypothetical protein
MAKIDIQSEIELKSGWSYEVKLDDKSSKYHYSVTLSRSDYDLWSQGRVPPEKVVKTAFEFLLEHEQASAILTEFDCAVIRRYFPEVDNELPKKL